MKIEVTTTKSDLGKFLVNAKSAKFDETVILDSESDAKKTAQMIQKVFGGEYEKVEVYTGESEDNPAVVAVCDKKIAHVFTSEDENVAAAVTMFVKIIALKFKQSAKVKQ